MRALVLLAMMMLGTTAARAQQMGAAPSPTNDLPAAAVEGLPPAQDLGGISIMGLTCAVAAGEVWCWGDCSRGVCGKGGTDKQHTPRKVPGVRGAASVHVTPTAACARHTDGAVSCWGSPDAGLFGAKGRAYAPRRMPFGRVTQVALGPGFLCALGADRKVRCLGNNYRGQLGQGPVYALHGTGDAATVRDVGRRESRTPLVVRGVTDAVAVTAGDAFACALTAGGRVLCWGEAYKHDREVPSEREAGVESSLDRFRDREDDDDDEDPTRVMEPARVYRDGSLHELALPRPAIAISASSRGALALLDDHTVVSWDYYPLELPTAKRRPRSNPLPPVRALGESTWHVITEGGVVYPLGGPRPVALLPPVEELSGSCARTADGAIWCWGTNEHGQLGRPATPYYLP